MTALNRKPDSPGAGLPPRRDRTAAGRGACPHDRPAQSAGSMPSVLPGPGAHRDSMARDQATTVASSARRVLVIDDEPRIRSFTTRALSSAGFTVTEAATGPEGLTAA